MDFLKTKNVFFNGKEMQKLFYGDKLIWSKMRTDFSKDFKNLREEEDWEGNLLYDTLPSILELNSFGTWGKTIVTKNDDIYTVKRDATVTGGWGMVTDQKTRLTNGQIYTLYAEIATKDITQFSYNFIISADGNQGIGRINPITDGQFHPYILTFTPNKDRGSAGILFGADKRNNSGTEYQIRNVALYIGDRPQVMSRGILPKGFKI